MVVLLSCTSLTIVLGSLLELDTLKGSLGYWRAPRRVRSDPSIGIVCISNVGRHRRIVAVHTKVTMSTGFRLRHEGNPGRVLGGTLVPLRGVLNELNRMLIIVSYDGRDAHGEALDCRGLGPQ